MSIKHPMSLLNGFNCVNYLSCLVHLIYFCLFQKPNSEREKILLDCITSCWYSE